MSGIKNLSSIKEELKESDILCLCETWHTLRLNYKQTGNHEVFDSVGVKTFDRGRASGGLAMTLSNLLYKNTELISARDNFIFIKTNINNDTVIIGVVYINQKKDVKIILGYVEEELIKINNKYINSKIIIGGDFNARIANKGDIEENQLPDQESIFLMKRLSRDTELDSRGRDLVEFAERNDLYVTNGRFPGDIPAGFTHKNKLGKTVIDLILCNTEALYNVTEVKIFNTITKSDHFPVSINVNFRIKIGNLNLKKEKLKWKKELEENYYNNMLYSNNVSKVDLNLNEMAIILSSSIKEVAKSVKIIKLEKNINSNFIVNNPWFDTDCQTAKIKLKEFSKQLRKKNYPSDQVEIFHKDRLEYFRLLDSKKNEYLLDSVAQILRTKDSQKFWFLINSFRYIIKTCNEHIDLNTWTNYFKKVYESDINVNEHILLNNNSDPILDAEINLEEIYLALNKCKDNKAPGVDGITFEFLKNLPQNWLLYINTIFNKIMRQESIPDSWSEIITKMLYKKGDILNPENYRPISLVNVVLKLFTLVLLNRLTQWCEANNTLPEWQAGFRENRSTIDNIFTLNSIINTSIRKKDGKLKGGKLYALAVDLKNAFPSVPHNLLWNKLSKLGISYKYINIVKDLYTKANMAVKTNDGYSEKCSITKGVLQGETLSPKLYSLYIADLGEFLEENDIKGVQLDERTSTPLLAFADDMFFLSESALYHRKLITVLEKYLDNNKLELNTKKKK